MSGKSWITKHQNTHWFKILSWVSTLNSFILGKQLYFPNCQIWNTTSWLPIRAHDLQCWPCWADTEQSFAGQSTVTHQHFSWASELQSGYWLGMGQSWVARSMLCLQKSSHSTPFIASKRFSHGRWCAIPSFGTENISTEHTPQSIAL